MGYQKDRESFIVRCVEEGLSEDCARALLRNATTLQRLAELNCNGPVWIQYRNAKPGEYERWQARLDAKDAAAESRVTRWLADTGTVPDFQGDPRGAVLKVTFPSKRGNSWGDPSQFCVPTR